MNARDAMGLTPLHHACTRGNTNAVRELIQCAGIGMEVNNFPKFFVYIHIYNLSIRCSLSVF